MELSTFIKSFRERKILQNLFRGTSLPEPAADSASDGEAIGGEKPPFGWSGLVGGFLVNARVKVPVSARVKGFRWLSVSPTAETALDSALPVPLC